MTALLAIGLLLRVTWILVHDVEPTSDFAAYHLLARSLAERGAYGFELGAPDTFWPPGWPVVVSGVYWLLGPNPTAGALLGAFLECGAILLAAVAASRLLRPAFAAGAVAGMCFYPGAIAYAPVLGTEHLAALLFTGLVVLVAFARPSSPIAFGAGLLTGALLLTRADYGVAMAAIVAVWLLLPRTSLRRALALAAMTLGGCLVLIGPWTVRNAVHFGDAIPTDTHGGATFYLGTVAPLGTPSPVVDDLYQNSGMSPAAIDHRLYALGLENIRDHPLRWLKFDAHRIYEQYGRGDGTLFFWGRIGAGIPARLASGVVNVANVYWLGVLGFALVGFWAIAIRLRRLPSPWVTIAASILAVSILKTFFVVNVRDRLPLTYLLIVVAGLGAQTIGDRLATVRSR
jgi:hypothetical protein